MKEGLKQLEGTTAKLGVEEAFLVLFDQRRSAEEVPWEDRPRWEEAYTGSGRRVRVLRL